jgi:hypothetical protein
MRAKFPHPPRHRIALGRTQMDETAGFDGCFRFSRGVFTNREAIGFRQIGSARCARLFGLQGEIACIAGLNNISVGYYIEGLRSFESRQCHAHCRERRCPQRAA